MAVVAGPDQHVVRLIGEVGVVLAVDEEQIHADRRRRALEHVGDAEQHGDAGRAVVGAGHGHGRLFRVGPSAFGRVSQWAEEQHPLRGRGLEPRDEVGERERVAVGGDVGPRLDDQRVGPLAQEGCPATPPGAGVPRCWGSGGRRPPGPRRSRTRARRRTPSADGPVLPGMPPSR